jgi:4-amino-4-deoxy-L-arabinose transferase-like glycosyltransferase
VRRRLLSFLSVLSLLLCVATLAWWVRSFLPSDLHVGATDGRMVVLFCDASLTQSWESNNAHVSAADKWKTVRSGQFIRPTAYVLQANTNRPAVPVQANTPPRVHSFLGFAFATEAPPPSGTYYLFTIPLLVPAFLLAVPPALALIARRRARHRNRGGLCAACGYDLRGTPDRCPECGAVPQVVPG